MISEVYAKKFLLILAMLGAEALMISAPVAAAQSLDYEFFKTRVQPIFLKKRGDHARCAGCHAGSTNALHLEELSPGAASWTEEQSRRNFETVSKLVVPGNPAGSRFLLHPLAPEAGGDPRPTGAHQGGRQFADQKDPDWQTLADWVRGKKAAGGQ